MQILQQTEITSFNVLLGVLIIGIGFILGVLIYTKTYNQNVFLSFIAIGIVLGTFCGIKYQVPTGEIKYQVSLNEEIKATEFLENYEVLSKENNTYWIKGRKWWK